MPHVNKTVRAERDLDDIWFHIALDNVAAADALIDTICERSYVLATQPKVGRARPELFVNLRSHPVSSYVIFYRPEADGIEIVRVLHSARDVTTIADEGGFET